MSDGDAHHEIEALFGDLAEGTLSPDEIARIEAHLVGCAACRDAKAAYQRTVAALGGLGRAVAPPALTSDVTAAIHKRSGGRFFGRRAFGDRVPFELLALIALGVLVALFLLIRFSSTGSLR
jgi:anti-sigma factor RsiW